MLSIGPIIPVQNFEVIFDKISTLESLIKLTLNECKDKEIRANYYDIPFDNIINLSEERNNYINMLTVALEKIEQIKIISSNLEINSLDYKSTPTMAADK